MKNLIILFFLAALGIQSNSCGSDGSAEAQKVALEFAEAMKRPVDFKTMKKLYVDFDRVSVWRVDDYKLKSTSKKGKQYEVVVYTFFETSTKKVENDITFILEEREGEWKIVDSVNLDMK